MLIYGIGDMETSYDSDVGDKGYSSAPWIQHHTTFTTLRVEYGVKTISEKAFYRYHTGYEFTSVEIANTVTAIGDEAFAHSYGQLEDMHLGGHRCKQ